MIIFERMIEKSLKNSLFLGKVICLYGPRQAGKTTLSKKILAQFGNDGYYLNCEDARERNYLVVGRPDILKNYISDKKIVVLDEAQSVENIGQILKVFVDTYPEVQLVATGSSSFDLANKVGEPLVGRSVEFFLYPLSVKELILAYDQQEVAKNIDTYIRFGAYPAVVTSLENKKIENLSGIANNYLYKDIFTFEQIRKPRLIEDLLKLIALQVGSEVSLNEIAQKIEVSRKTIERYLELLEKSFVIKRLYSFKRNLRDEIRGNFKIYFYDLGVRNYLINNFNPLEIRSDAGALFENFFVMERIKYHHNATNRIPPIYFWRTYQQQEIDFLEERDGALNAFECTLSDKKQRNVPKLFLKTYPESRFTVANKINFIQYVI